MSIEKLKEAFTVVSEKTRRRPKVAVILGSGLGAFAREVSPCDTILYSEIPHYPRSSVPGHSGKLVVGHFAGCEIAVLAGRVHGYEGYEAADVVFPVRLLGKMGVRALVVTNAAGAINMAFRPGELMLIQDHLNLTGKNPLVGPEHAALGQRFTDMSEAYWSKGKEVAETASRRIGLTLRKGVYAGLLGPSFETPAEIRMLRTVGADAVGMSTVWEVIAANQAGMKVLGMSCLTNMAAGISKSKLDHQEVIETGERVRGVFLELVREIVPALARVV